MSHQWREFVVASQERLAQQQVLEAWIWLGIAMLAFAFVATLWFLQRRRQKQVAQLRTEVAARLDSARSLS